MNNWADHFTVIYDLSRLVGRMHAGHATGVDRVDLHYALWMHASAGRWRAVVQQSNSFVLLEEDYVDTLLTHLSRRWLGYGVESAASSLKQPSGWRRDSRRALREKLSRGSLGTVFAERGIPAALWSRLPCVSRGPSASSGFWEDCSNAIYVNIGHCFCFEAAMQSIPDVIRRIYFLHDVIPLTHPETQKATSRAHFKKFCEYVGHPMSNVVVSSQATVNAIAALPQGEHQLLKSTASIRVCPLPVEDRFIVERHEGLKGETLKGLKGDKRNNAQESDYFLSVGTIEPRKNLELLVRVWEQLIESKETIPKLIWVGKFGWSCDRQLMRRFEGLQALGHVELRTGVEDSDLLDLMTGAIALLFPSKVEGWGLPLSEALTMGVPAIASRIAVFEAVGQGVPELLELDDLDNWKSMILNYAATDSKLRSQQIQRMQSYEPLAWTQHFEQLEALWGTLSS